jgi:hypothetical protein
MKLKKILAAALIFAMLFSLVAVTPALAVDLVGNGTSESPLQIGTEADLFEFASRVAAGGSGLCAVLTDDITVADWSVISIGRPSASQTSDSPTPYAGTFDGGGHTLTLTKKVDGLTTASSGVALFHTVTKDGVVKNLNYRCRFPWIFFCWRRCCKKLWHH